jgi:hypothetical protein
MAGVRNAWGAVLVPHAGNPRGEPWLDGKVTQELSQGGQARKEPRGARTRIDDVPHVASVVVSVPLELAIAFRSAHLNMLASCLYW